MEETDRDSQLATVAKSEPADDRSPSAQLHHTAPGEAREFGVKATSLSGDFRPPSRCAMVPRRAADSRTKRAVWDGLGRV